MWISNAQILIFVCPPEGGLSSSIFGNYFTFIADLRMGIAIEVSKSIKIGGWKYQKTTGELAVTVKGIWGEYGGRK